MSDIFAQALAVSAEQLALSANASASTAATVAQNAYGTITPVNLGVVSGILNTISFTTNGRYYLTTGGNISLPNWSSSFTPGVQIDLFITQGGAYNLTFDPNYTVPVGSSLSSIIGAVDVISIAILSNTLGIVRISNGVNLSPPGATTLTSSFTVPITGNSANANVANGSQYSNGTCVVINSSPPMYGLVTAGGGTNTLTLQNLYSNNIYGQIASTNSSVIVSGLPGVNAYTVLTSNWNCPYPYTTSTISVANPINFPIGSYGIVHIPSNGLNIPVSINGSSPTTLTVVNLSPYGPFTVASGSYLLPTGTPGTVWKTGNTDPSSTYFGAYGDLYLNTTTGNVFQWTQDQITGDTYWNLISNLKGPQGATGPGATNTTANATISSTTILPVISGTAFPNKSYVFASDGANTIQGQVTSGGGTTSLSVTVASSTGTQLNSNASVTFSGVTGATGPRGPSGGSNASRPGTISNYATNSSSLSFTAYSMPDSTGTFAIVAGVINNKSITSSWTVGSNGGLLDTGTASANTTYHIYVICKSDGTGGDYIASLSATGPTLPSSYVGGYYVRIASLPLNASKQFVNFTHRMGNVFFLTAAAHDASQILTATTIQYLTLSVPTGIRVKPISRFNGSAGYTTIASTDEPCVSTIAFNNNGTAGFDIATSATTVSRYLLTNTSGQIQYISGYAGYTLSCWTLGWEDPGISWGY